MKRVDVDRDGVINFTEFLRAVTLQKQVRKEQDDEFILRAFEQCGGNGDKSGKVGLVVGRRWWAGGPMVVVLLRLLRLLLAW
jgi:hypothetical protein